MSADNWTTCPRCTYRANAVKKKLRAQVEEQYGQIPQSEYETLRNEAYAYVDIQEEFREDYEIFSDHNTVYVSYSGACRICSFKFYFESEHVMEGWDE